MSTIIALYVASIKEFVRDRAAIFWTLAFPVLFIVLFGVIFNAPSSSYDIGIVNLDTGATGQQFVQTFKDIKSSGSNLFKVTTYTSQDAALTDLRAGKHDMVIVVPANLSTDAANSTPRRSPSTTIPQRAHRLRSSLALCRASPPASPRSICTRFRN